MRYGSSVTCAGSFIVAVPTASASQGSHNLFDTILAAGMILAALAFVTFIYVRTGTGRLASYELTARIPNAAGLDLGSDVRIGGVKVGRISGLSLDQRRHLAVVQMKVRDDLAIPVDSQLAVEAPLGGSLYLTIRPGHGAAIAPGGSFPSPAPIKRPANAPSS
jgi:phospholipid/cholesterol/gamma-HCH transport system substrate-binding protein